MQDSRLTGMMATSRLEHEDRPGMEGVMVADLPAAAREREVLATVADGIIAAAAGKGLRAEVACPPAHLPFAGQLTKALHARGLPCRCLAPSPESPRSEPAAPPRRADDPALVVIVDATPGISQAEECRISIHVIDDRQAADPQPGSSDWASGSYRDSGQALQMVVDYSHPDGPSISHMSAQLATSTESAASTLTKGGQ